MTDAHDHARPAASVTPMSPEERVRLFAEARRIAHEKTPSARRMATHRLAAEARRLTDLVIRTGASIQQLNEAAGVLQALVDVLEAYGVKDRRDFMHFAEIANAGDAFRASDIDDVGFFDDSPIVGLANPLAPPLRVQIHDDHVVGLANFGQAYEGPPGCVHGGYIAAAFDDLLGATQSLGGRPGMTGRLTIHYRRPHPLHAEIRYIGRVERVEGRKTFTVGQSFLGDDLLAEAEGLFIAVDYERLAAGAPPSTPRPHPATPTERETTPTGRETTAPEDVT